MTTDLDRVRLVRPADRDLCRDCDLDRERRLSLPEWDGDLERLLRRGECDLDLVLMPCRETDLERLRCLGDRDLDLRCDRLADGDLDLCLPDLWPFLLLDLDLDLLFNGDRDFLELSFREDFVRGDLLRLFLDCFLSLDFSFTSPLEFSVVFRGALSTFGMISGRS